MTPEKFQDKCRGALVGGAAGDALGYPVEFIYSFEQIAAKYGEAGITRYDLSDPWIEQKSGKALFSDDTQMALYTAEGLLEAEKNGRQIVPTICNAYLAWFGRQVGKDVRIAYDSQLAKIDELNQNRAPGNTCLSALQAIYGGKEPLNNSKGCGGVMRVAPIGIYGAAHGWPLDKTGRIAGEAAELTHKHPLSTYSSAALAIIVQLCLNAENVDAEEFKSIVAKAMETVRSLYGESAEFEEIISKALSFEHSLLPDWQVIERELGEGWVADEALAIAIFSVLRHVDEFRDCIVCAVNHGGDSDSTGALAGNIIGAIVGWNEFPIRFLLHIQLGKLLESMANALSQNN